MSKEMAMHKDFLIEACAKKGITVVADKKGVTVADVLRIFPGSRVVSGPNGEPDEELQLSLYGEV